MAKSLARIILTEEDQVNCPFYFKTGACRYGDRCTRRHLKPAISQTLLFKGMYENPPIAIAMAEGHRVPDEQIMAVIEQFHNFYSEVFLELAKFGEIEDMQVCDNIGDHLIGNVYVKFASEDNSEKCRDGITGRYYANRLVVPSYSPVTNFREGRCRQYETDSCKSKKKFKIKNFLFPKFFPKKFQISHYFLGGGKCNFMHLKIVPRDLKKALFKEMYKRYPQYKEAKRHRGKEERRARKRHKRRERSRSQDKKKKRKTKTIKKKRRRSSRGSEKRSSTRSESKSAERGGDTSQNIFNMTSEERRALIASWGDKDADGGKNEE